MILAGGAATRMGGGDKGRLAIGGRSLLSRVIDRLEPQVNGLALSANGDPERFADLGLPVVADSLADRPGPLAGVLAGLDWAAGRGAEAIVTAAADSPFLPLDLVTRLERVGGLVLARSPGGRQPTFGRWPVSLRADLRSALAEGVRKVVIFTRAMDGAWADFPDDDAFFNVNTPEDLAQAETRL